MNKFLAVQVLQLLILCLVLIFGATLLTSFLLLESRRQEEPSPQMGCGYIDFVVNPRDDLTLMDSTQIAGKHLFEENCSMCHSPNDEAVVGPGLQGVTERQSVKWIVRWVQNPQRVLQREDKYAVKLYKKFNKAQMTAFPNLNESEIRAILSYIERKSFAEAPQGDLPSTGSTSRRRVSSPTK